MKRILLIRHLPDAKPPGCVCHPSWDCEHSSVNPQPRDPCLCINDLNDADPDTGCLTPAKQSDSGCLSPYSPREDSECCSATAPRMQLGMDDCRWAVSPRIDTLGQIVSHFGPDLIVTSPLRRAIMTAGILFQQHDSSVKILVHPGAREKNHKKKVANWPLPVARLRQVLRCVPRGGDMDLGLMEEVGNISGHEDLKDADQRVDAFCQWLLGRPESAIAVVAHGGVIKHLLNRHHAPPHGSAIECIADRGTMLVPYNEFIPGQPCSPLDHTACDLSFCFVQTLHLSPVGSPPTQQSLLDAGEPSAQSPEERPPSKDPSENGSVEGMEADTSPQFIQLLCRMGSSPKGATAELCPFSQQVSGRHLMFNTPDGKLYKEAHPKELAFYLAISKTPHPLQQFIAHFFDEKTIHGSELLKAKRLAMQRCAVCRDPTPCNSCAHFSLACKLLRNFDPEVSALYRFVALRDVTKGLAKPCVIDIKMGRRQYGYGASEAKIRSKELKTRKSTSRNLFFRICGYKVYKSVTDCWRSVQKEQAQRLTKHQVQREMENFFDNGNGLRFDVLELILPRIRALFAAFSHQRDWHFITSSLLLVYDGDPQGPGLADICMIDFANTERVEGALDTEYLYALANLVELLECILHRRQYQPPSTPPYPYPGSAITAAAVERVLKACPTLEPRVVRSPVCPNDTDEPSNAPLFSMHSPLSSDPCESTDQ
eukprot:GGOE01018041.1.p1 GENE.GGOE01018041.1~~GGOE01018041.1.p1  ORF type:complete len:711 (+),score=198.64 GGOE01018041.1:27-2159(+)